MVDTSHRKKDTSEENNVNYVLPGYGKVNPKWLLLMRELGYKTPTFTRRINKALTLFPSASGGLKSNSIEARVFAQDVIDRAIREFGSAISEEELTRLYTVPGYGTHIAALPPIDNTNLRKELNLTRTEVMMNDLFEKKLIESAKKQELNFWYLNKDSAIGLPDCVLRDSYASHSYDLKFTNNQIKVMNAIYTSERVHFMTLYGRETLLRKFGFCFMYKSHHRLQADSYNKIRECYDPRTGKKIMIDPKAAVLELGFEHVQAARVRGVAGQSSVGHALGVFSQAMADIFKSSCACYGLTTRQQLNSWYKIMELRLGKGNIKVGMADIKNNDLAQTKISIKYFCKTLSKMFSESVGWLAYYMDMCHIIFQNYHLDQKFPYQTGDPLSVHGFNTSEHSGWIFVAAYNTWLSINEAIHLLTKDTFLSNNGVTNSSLLDGTGNLAMQISGDNIVLIGRPDLVDTGISVLKKGDYVFWNESSTYLGYIFNTVKGEFEPNVISTLKTWVTPEFSIDSEQRKGACFGLKVALKDPQSHDTTLRSLEIVLKSLEKLGYQRKDYLDIAYRFEVEQATKQSSALPSDLTEAEQAFLLKPELVHYALDPSSIRPQVLSLQFSSVPADICKRVVYNMTREHDFDWDESNWNKLK